MSQPSPPKWMPTPKTDPLMKPRSPRPSHPNQTQRTRLRALTQLNPTNSPRILNYFCFPNLADELHFHIECGNSLSNSDSEDSDYELPPQTIHREGKQLPKTQIKWYKEGEECAAKELKMLEKMPGFNEKEDWYGLMVLPKPESEDEEDADLDSPSRQLRGELSQMSQVSQSEVKRVQKEDDDDDESEVETQPVVMPIHEEVMLWVTQTPAVTSAVLKRKPSGTEFWDGDDECEERNHKRKRIAQDELVKRLNGKT